MSTTTANERITQVRVALIATLTTNGHKVEVDDWRGVTVDGINIQFQLKEDQSTSWPYRGKDKLRIHFGCYGSKRMFPEPKTGFNVPKIVGETEQFVASELAKRAMNQKAADARMTVAPLVAALNKEFAGGRGNTCIDSQGEMAIEVRHTRCTEEQARKLHEALRDIFGA